MKQNWGIWTTNFNNQKNEEFEILQWDQGSTCAVVTVNVMVAQFGRGGKAAVGGYTGVVINEPHYMLPVLEW